MRKKGSNDVWLCAAELRLASLRWHVRPLSPRNHSQQSSLSTMRGAMGRHRHGPLCCQSRGDALDNRAAMSTSGAGQAKSSSGRRGLRDGGADSVVPPQRDLPRRGPRPVRQPHKHYIHECGEVGDETLEYHSSITPFRAGLPTRSEFAPNSLTDYRLQHVWRSRHASAGRTLPLSAEAGQIWSSFDEMAPLWPKSIQIGRH